MIQLSILGCGWLGLPLAKSLLKKQFIVKGSTTTNDKIAILDNSSIEPFLITLNENAIEGDFQKFIYNSKILIIDIPPKLRGNNKENFVAKITNIISLIEKSTIKKIIFISSTSVYADDNSVVTEATTPKPESEAGKQLLEVENILQNNTNFRTTVLRFGGLIGHDRNPINMLSGKTNIANPMAVINLIHQSDCIAIIEKIIETDSFGKIYNAVSPFHPTRKEYYTQKAIELNLPEPEFNYSKSSVGKTILSDYLCNDLGFKFQLLQ